MNTGEIRMKAHHAAVLLAVAGLALPAAAQDSVSLAAGLPGDAVSPWDVAEQLNTYVVDMAPLTTSWGIEFGIAPLVKSNKLDAAFFNALASSHSISNTVMTGTPYPNDSYSHWMGQGFGVNDNANLNQFGTPISRSGASTQFAVASSEFGGESNNVFGAIVNYDPSEPGRLYVSRINTAVNGQNAAENRAQVGYGTVDSSGNAYFRCDDFGASGPNPIVGNNLFRVDMAARNPGALNVIDNAGGSDAAATDWILVNSAVTHNTPSAIPEDLAGRPILAGSNFSDEYVYEVVPNVLTGTTAHLGTASHHRGNVSFSKFNWFGGNAVGTCSLYGQDAAGDTRKILVWGVDNAGTPTAGLQLDLPTNFIDNADGFDTGSIAPTDELGNYRSQVAFRGGNGQVALGIDRNGQNLAAVMVTLDIGLGSENPVNCIAVARQNTAGGFDWTTAAYNNFPNGKALLDGAGVPIGQIVELNQVTGGSPLGPSFSCPMIDSVGNVWFLAAVEIFDAAGGPSDFDSGLVRAVYDAATFSYTLELVMSVGDVFHGENSDTDYMISFLSIADSNSASSGTMFSGNMIQSSWNDADVSGLDASDSQTLGGLAVVADITYDLQGDGIYNDPTSSNFDPSFPADESYQVLMYIGNTVGDECAADFNGDGTVNTLDFLAFLNAFSAGDPSADFNGDGTVNTLDFLAFLNAFNDGC